MQNNTKQIIKLALKDTMPVMAGYVVMGIGFGVLLRVNGYNFLWSILMGLVIYSGTMQFVAIDLITAPASLFSTAITALMMGARHLFYGLSVVDKYDKNKSAFKKFYSMYALTDETYSLVCNADDLEYCFYVSVLDHSYWVIGGVIGSLLGEVLPFNPKGIDFSLTALFITICVDQWRDKKNRLPALIGLGAGILSLIIFGRENLLIPTMILIITGLFFIRGHE